MRSPGHSNVAGIDTEKAPGLTAAFGAALAPAAPERRQNPRFCTVLPMQYTILSGRLRGNAGSGNILNLSSSGVALTARTGLRRGTSLELTVPWPSRRRSQFQTVAVLRVSVVRPTADGAAARIVSSHFRTEARRSNRR